MSGGGYQGYRSDEWTDDELQLLYDHATDPSYMHVVGPALPHRTRSAIQQRMCALRKEAGISAKGIPRPMPPSCADLELMRKMERELASCRGGMLAAVRAIRHEERATAACNDRRPDTSER